MIIFRRRKPASQHLTMEALDERLRAKEQEAAQLWQWIKYLNHARVTQNAEQQPHPTIH